jgi:hypothetical protein
MVLLGHAVFASESSCLSDGFGQLRWRGCWLAIARPCGGVGVAEVAKPGADRRQRLARGGGQRGRFLYLSDNITRTSSHGLSRPGCRCLCITFIGSEDRGLSKTQFEEIESNRRVEGIEERV